MIATKGEFAKLANVSAGRVSQWISAGKITQAEMVGEGRDAKINVEAAFAKLNLRLDFGQRNGNGLGTILKLVQPTKEFKDPEPPKDEADQLDLKLKQAKLAQAESANRKLAEDERARQGIYVLAEHASAEAGKLTSTIVQMFESGLVDMAAKIASTYQLPNRDVIHLMRKEMREVRVKISASLASELADMPSLQEDETA